MRPKSIAKLPSNVAKRFGSKISTSTFLNQLPHLLSTELNDAAKVGATRLRTFGPEFDTLVNSDMIKWVVTESGELIVGAARKNSVEISHAFLTNGRVMRAAGEANIAASGGTRIGIEITNHSGHFMPSQESLMIGVEAFKKIGVTF